MMSTETNFTPGPYSMVGYENGYPASRLEPGMTDEPASVYATAPNGDEIELAQFAQPTYMVEPSDEFDSGERYLGDADANARLFMAAPELVASLQDVLRTGLNGANNIRLAYLACGGHALSDDLLAKADESEAAVERARKALAMLHPVSTSEPTS